MSQFDYEKARSRASTMIFKFGTESNFSRVNSTFDIVSGQRTITSVDTKAVKLVSLPVNEGKKMFDKKLLEDNTISEHTFFLTESRADGYEPDAGDLLDFGGKIWEVFGVSPLNPSGQTNVIFYVGVKVSALDAIPSP